MADAPKKEKPEAWRPPEERWMKWYPREQFALPHEDLDLYTPGGLHPVDLGDKFSSERYTIHHKIGFGGFSTVWLARDNLEEKWVSLKIQQADFSTKELLDNPEIKALRLLEQRHAALTQPTPRYFPTLLDSFQHVGPNGTHNCIVTELLGPSLDVVQMLYNDIFIQETLLPDTILRASRQLLEAVAFFHEAGIVHGDISMGNLCFTCYSALETDEYLWRDLGGQPHTVPYESEEPRPAHLPKNLVRVASWASWYDSPWEDICLVDWSESFPIDESRSSIPQPWNMRSPEGFFLKSYDRHLDLWRAGGLISALFYQMSPFDGHSVGSRYIGCLVGIMGPLPPSWDKQWEEMLPDGKRPESSWRPYADTFEPRRQKIIEKAEKNEQYANSEYAEDDYQALRCLLNVLNGLLKHEPEKRISAREALAGIDWIDHWREERWGDGGDEGSETSLGDDESRPQAIDSKSGEVEDTCSKPSPTLDAETPPS